MTKEPTLKDSPRWNYLNNDEENTKEDLKISFCLALHTRQNSSKM